MTIMVQTEVVVGTRKWGNNLGVRLPDNVAKVARRQADQMVRIMLADDSITISALQNPALKLEQ